MGGQALSQNAAAYIGIAAMLAVVAAVVWLGVVLARWSNEQDARCHDRGGLRIQDADGLAVCIKVEVIADRADGVTP